MRIGFLAHLNPELRSYPRPSSAGIPFLPLGPSPKHRSVPTQRTLATVRDGGVLRVHPSLGCHPGVWVAALLDSVFGLETHLSELPAKRPHEFLSGYFVEGSLLFILYSLYVIVAAVVMGAYEVPSRVATGIAKGSGLLARWVVRVPGLRWIKPPRPNFPQEPIWYHAFHVATGGFVEAQLSVLVRMKTGDIYYGEIEVYPVLPDSQREKDFLIRRAVYTRVGTPGKIFRLEDQPGGGTVLLNSADVDSMQIYYAPTEGSSNRSV